MPNVENDKIKLAIAIPTYNEADNLTDLILKIKNTLSQTKTDCTLLIIDDSSPDGTGKVAEALKKSLKTKIFRIMVLHRQQKDGLGKAYIEGFQLLLKRDYTHILQMDADLSHDPKYLPEFIKAAGRSDFVVGSRYITSGATPDWTIARKLQSRAGNLYSRVLLGSKIHDYTGGYNLFSKDLLKSLDLDSITASGYGFLIELKYRAVLNAKNIAEIPIVFTDRIHGHSKIPRSTILKNFIIVPAIRTKLRPNKQADDSTKDE